MLAVGSMHTTLSLTFSAVRYARAAAVLHFVRLIPALTEGAAADADLGLRGQGRYLVLRLRLADALVSGAILDRLQFWCARAGGHAAPALGEVASECDRRLRDADFARRGIDATAIGEVLGPVLVESCGLRLPGVEPDGLQPVLHLQIWGPGWSGVTYDGTGRALFVPTPLAPAVGDGLAVQLETTAPIREVARADACVTAVSRHQPGEMTGFTVTLLDGSDAVHRVLSVTCSSWRPSDCKRATQRFPVSARVAVAGQEATLVDLSHGGAFIRTPDPFAVGEDVDVQVRLPNETTLQTTATVIHSNPDGMGVQFRLDPSAGAALASVMTSIAARRPHVLVVDDDALARRMLADAFQQGGYDVLTAPDADFAMHSLADQILTLDLLVTDLLMPGVDGEQLIRTIRRVGGEIDLPILVISGQVDDALKDRMRAAGADAVLAKALGVESIVRMADDVVARRRPAPPMGAPPLPLDAAR